MYTVPEIQNIYSQKWNCEASYLGAIYLFPQSFLFGISIFLYCMRELSAQLQERREGQGTATKLWLAVFPCLPLRSCGWAGSSHKWPTYKFPIWKIMDHKWKQLILLVIFLFAFRVNETPNKTFILDSHRPFICSAGVTAPLVQLPQALTLRQAWSQVEKDDVKVHLSRTINDLWCLFWFNP